MGDMPVWSLAGELCYREPDDAEAGEEDVWGAHLAGLLLTESAWLDRVSRGKQDVFWFASETGWCAFWRKTC